MFARRRGAGVDRDEATRERVRVLNDEIVAARVLTARKNSLASDHLTDPVLFIFEMAGGDVFDQSFAAYLMNPDLTIYGRFGTRSGRRASSGAVSSDRAKPRKHHRR